MNDPYKNNPNGADYDEKVDITSLHAAVMREKAEPSDGNEPISLWVVALFGFSLFLGGGYLMYYSGGFRVDEYNIFAGRTAPGKVGKGDEKKEELTLAQQGEKVFKQNCVSCHQASGAGIPGQYPPLIGVEYVTGSEKRLVALLLHGVQGELHVNGQTYNGQMPAWANLNDKRLAAVATYIRSAWGNKAGEINEAQAAAGRAEFKDRKTPWTQAELDAMPADGTLPGGGAAPAPAEGDAAPAPAAPAAS